MQPSARQQELERLYNSRRGHVPQISISDDDHHVTEAIGSYYDDADSNPKPSARPYSFVSAPSEASEGKTLRTGKSKRHASYFGSTPPRLPLSRTGSNEKLPSSPPESGNSSPKSGGGGGGSMKRMSSAGSGSENANGTTSPTTPPPLSRQPSTGTAVSQFPLNDIDYESSPAAVAQELSNLQAIRRMSMNVDTGDPDLPSFGGAVPTVAPTGSGDDDDTSRLFWVPARLHPELAPKEFKTFVEDRVDQIRRRSGDSDRSLSPDGLDRTGSASSLRRKKSMLSRQIDSQDNYEDGAERLERKRSKHMPVEGQAQVELSELEGLVSDPAQLMRRMSLDTARRSQDSGVEVPASEDMPILPPVGQSLKRSTRTTYRRGSLKKGERVPFSKRAQQRQGTPEPAEEASGQSSSAAGTDEPIMGLTRVQTEPSPPSARSARDTFPSRTDSSLRWRESRAATSAREEPAAYESQEESSSSQRPTQPQPTEDDEQPQRPQQRQFQSRLASGPGRTTAQLPGYNNTNPLPHVVETLSDGSKVPSANLLQQQPQQQPQQPQQQSVPERSVPERSVPERKSSHDVPRPFQRGGAHMRPVPGREHHRSSTLDDISANPSPLPGSGSTRTDALTMVPTFDESKKSDKKEGGRKSSWKWKFSSDDDEKRAKAEEKAKDDSKSTKSKLSKATGGDKARLDVLQNSIDGTNPARGRESLVLSREDVRLDEERKKESKRATEPKKEKEKDGKESGLLSVFFGGKKKTSDTDLKEKKRKSDRNLASPEPLPRILKPDIDYNWTRFSILEERAIYRMAHIKLANPRRALYSQVLLSNFMYSYLAKVQMMHPQVQIPAAHQKAQQRGVKQQEEQQQQQPVEYSQYQRWQQQQEREAAAAAEATPNTNPTPPTSTKRTSLDIATTGGQQQQQQNIVYEDEAGYDARSSEEYDYDYSYQQHQQPAQQRTNGVRGGGYSVAGSHDYLGYPKDRQPFSQQGDSGGGGGGGGGGFWEDDEAGRDLW